MRTDLGGIEARIGDFSSVDRAGSGGEGNFGFFKIEIDWALEEDDEISKNPRIWREKRSTKLKSRVFW